MSLGYNLPLLAAVIAMAQNAGSFRLGDLQSAPFGLVTGLAAIAFLVAIPARLKSNPFSIPNAEQEIVGGAHIEYNSAPLAIFELSHALEVVLLFGVFFVLFVPRLGNSVANASLYFAVSLVLIVLATLTAAMTARLTVKRAFRFYWIWGGLAAAAAMVVAVIG